MALALYSSYSYSEELVFGTTQNAAASGYNWLMSDVLPRQVGLQVNSVIYRYTAIKNPEDGMVVYIQNKNAIDGGYVFRSSDNWSGLPGNTISKVMPVANIPIQYWGDGSLEVEGRGKVENASVIYAYQYDPCFNPQSSPSCPGYKDPFEFIPENINIKDPLDDEYVRQQLERKAKLEDEEENERQRKKKLQERKLKKGLEAALGAVNSSLLTAEAEAQAAELIAMNVIPSSYYLTIPGGSYEESVKLVDKKLPDSRKGLRMGLAQQLLHEKMVESQYKN